MAGTVGVNFAIGASCSSTVASAFGTISSRVRGLRTDLRGLETQSKAANRLSAAQVRLQNTQARYAAAPSAELRTAVRTATREFSNAQRAAKQYDVDITNLGSAHDALTSRIQRTQAALSRQQRLQANQNKRKELQGEMLGTVGAVMAVAAPLKLAIEYETDFADLKKVADFASKEQEKKVQQDIFDTARRTGINASGVTKIAAAAAESGVANDAQGNLDQEKLKNFLNDAAEMSVAFGISAEEAGKRLSIFQSRLSEDGMNLTAAQTKELGDAMNYVGSKMNATAADTSSVVARMGAVGSMAGLSAKSVAGLAAALVSTSENKETAGTAMKSFLLTLSQGDAMTKQQKEAFASIGIRNVKALAEGMKKGGPEAENTILTVLEAMKKMPESAQAGLAKEIFGTESLASLAPLINDTKKLAEAFRLANSKEAIGSQLREFKTRSTTTQGAIDRLKASTGILGITIGSVLLPPLASAANVAVAVVKPVTALTERFPMVTKVIMLTALALVALKVGALAGTYAATMLSDGWTIAKGILNFFRPSVLLTNAALVRQRTAALAAAAGTKIMAVGSNLAAAGQWILNAAFLGCPLTWIVGAVVALTAGMVYLYNTCEPVRAAFDSVFSYVGEKISWVVGKLKMAAEWLGILDETDSAADTTADTKSQAAPLKTASLEALNPATAMAGLPAAQQTAFPSAGSTAGSSSSTGAAAGGSVLQFSLSFPIHGVTDGDFAKRVIDALKHRQSDFESIISGIVNEQGRLTYGG